MNYSCDLLFALSIEYNIFVYLLQRKIMLEKDKVCDKKAYSDLNYVGH